jgi:hypothetical protein
MIEAGIQGRADLKTVDRLPVRHRVASGSASRTAIRPTNPATPGGSQIGRGHGRMVRRQAAMNQVNVSLASAI